VGSPFFKSESLTIKRGSEETREEFPLDGNGYNYEAIEVGRCLREGRIESDVMPLDETLALMKLLDTIREPWGLKYPSDG
jgi:hypothetical protein